MSTETGTRHARSRSARARRFALTLAAVLGALAVLSGAGAAVSLAQGPRLSGTQVDPSAATEVSGGRVILTVNQALAEIDPEQVTVTPAVPFTVDSSGRSVGVRFTVPLDDDTDYTVSVAGARAVGGGPAATIETSFRTPPAEVFLLQRDADGDDTIFRTRLDGAAAEPVYTAAEIDDFRATTSRLVVSTTEDGVSRLFTMGRDGSDPEAVALPGEGAVQGLQVSQRGELAGYTYTDPGGEGYASVLFTSRLRDPAADPVPVEIAGKAPSIDRWRFVADSSALLLVDFAGELILTDPESDAGPSPLGGAITIDAVARGTYTAIVERLDTGVVALDLTTGEEAPLVEPAQPLGALGQVAPIPGTADGGIGSTLRQYALPGDDGFPEPPVLAIVDADGRSRTVFETRDGDALLQSCVSPSGRYAAVLVAPNMVENPYDLAAQPVPSTVQTHIVELDTVREVSVLEGFDISWCAVGPW